jgi:hypothetical protein
MLQSMLDPFWIIIDVFPKSALQSEPFSMVGNNKDKSYKE